MKENFDQKMEIHIFVLEYNYSKSVLRPFKLFAHPESKIAMGDVLNFQNF